MPLATIENPLRPHERKQERHTALMVCHSRPRLIGLTGDFVFPDLADDLLTLAALVSGFHQEVIVLGRNCPPFSGGDLNRSQEPAPEGGREAGCGFRLPRGTTSGVSSAAKHAFWRGSHSLPLKRPAHPPFVRL
jgi:hypothetical protein